ncbi:ribosomal-protein-alanine N-acetyltransferase [Terribacillus halophilus]|uniref:Ribosomal-protein-alanine N-acetyltransferase n=1 Tax=Terribacillus halophilus TaxID=361279 RepID=A0A1G6WF23_9BACI|nr:GNAT family protein [Terribacillus halophilus]SDD63666.1 ribosomal-protein-alanine N-acetyltransferase [Terribacillus halophilus]
MTMYKIVSMTQSQAELIVNHWKYKGIYAFYNMDQDKEDMVEFLNPKARVGKVFAVKKAEELVGFCEIASNHGEAEIGFGMRPDLTGKGYGQEFVAFLVDYIISVYEAKRIYLSVAVFNKRAITVYERIGFRCTESFKQETNGSLYPFVRMILEVKNLPK